MNEKSHENGGRSSIWFDLLRLRFDYKRCKN